MSNEAGPWFIDKLNYRVVPVKSIHEMIDMTATAMGGFAAVSVKEAVSEHAYQDKSMALSAVAKMLNTEMATALDRVNFLNEAVDRHNAEVKEHERQK